MEIERLNPSKNEVPTAEQPSAQSDPIADLFVAQAARPSHLVDVNLRILSPFQRALLATDGTVTKFIEAYKMQPVDIRLLRQETRKLSSSHVWLEVQGHTDVVVREVALQGRDSQEIYAYAVSLIVPDRLSEPSRRALEVDGEGLGRILLKGRAETYREILWCGKERPTILPDMLRHLRGREFLSRTYRIIAAGKPIMLINEKFPCHGDDALPLHH
jgi:chorismate-pyruvate lyase